MDLKKYDQLRSKIHTKDFEGNNKSLDKWLYRLSFLGNIGSIFFAYFLVSPALNNAITTNLKESWGFALALIITIIILISFEALKRLLIRNFSFSLVKNKLKILKTKLLGWLIFATAIVCLSFYLSLNGARNFASTSVEKNIIAKTDLSSQIDSLSNFFEQKKSIYQIDNEDLREVTANLRKTMSETPTNYITVRKNYQTNIDKNTEIINDNEGRIGVIDEELQLAVAELRQEYISEADQNMREDVRNIWLFILISTSIEVLIIVGVYFREYYDYNLYIANESHLEGIYLKRDRYKLMLDYIYEEGKAPVNTRLMAESKIVELVSENSRIQDPKKFVKSFLFDMEKLDIFVVSGKRRIINATYQDALNVIDKFDDALRILENLK